MRKTVWGCGAALVALVACTAVLLAFRPHLSIATAALVLVIPVIVGVAVGGFGAGALTAVIGFFVYDWFFVPPYGTLTVGRPQDWVALVVYVLVVLIVARLVAVQQEARRAAASREEAIRRVFVVSESLIGERSLEDLLALVVRTVHETFRTRWVALLLPVDGELTIAATEGAALDDADRAAALGELGAAQSLALVGAHQDVSRIALTALQRPVGQLVVAGTNLVAFERQLLGTFANQAALAIEQSQLREQALRTEVLEEVDQWRSALVGAVSHDLRTPLASIKASVSTLRDESVSLSPEDHAFLLATIEAQSDHLARLVANLLDMARLETGTLTVHRTPIALDELLERAMLAVGGVLAQHDVVAGLDENLPLVDVDPVLITQVLANLLSNAAQHAPEGSTITVSAEDRGADIVVSVSDQGEGVAPADRERIFHMVDRHAGSGRAGLGLAISTAFVEAHGQSLTVSDTPGGGATFSFAVGVANLDAMPS